jgi:hypothetical protein
MITKNKNTNDDIILEIYRQMYKESKPKGNIDKIIKSGEGKKSDWFLKYYLSNERQDEIINEVLDKFKIKSKHDRGKFRTEILLGSAPSGQKK